MPQIAVPGAQSAPEDTDTQPRAKVFGWLGVD
jgi:hypothetical protein